MSAEGGAVRVVLDGAQVNVRCPNCGIELSLGKHTGHTVILNPSGVRIEPEFSCACGQTMRVRADQVERTGWTRLPPKKGIIPVPEPEGLIRPAIKIEKRAPVESASVPTPDSASTPSATASSKQDADQATAPPTVEAGPAATFGAHHEITDPEWAKKFKDQMENPKYSPEKAEVLRRAKQNVKRIDEVK